METNYLKISEVIRPDTVDLELKGVEDKNQAIEYLANLLDKAGFLADKETYINSVYEREEMGPTYMDHFIAIPHGKSAGVKEAGIAFGRSSAGFEYQTSSGGGLAKLIFLLAIPDRMSGDAYMAVLARLARLLVHEDFRNNLHLAETHQDVINAIIDGERLLEDL
ncbi:MAG: PTS sugar transporter subunit IIA [Anaerolineales bacterium]|nr:PTS sugar transporter subunit IIA [Anaerolineales bacterium]